MRRKQDRRRTDVVRVELVDTDEHPNGGRAQCPREDLSEDGELAGVEVVDEDRIELLSERVIVSVWAARRLQSHVIQMNGSDASASTPEHTSIDATTAGRAGRGVQMAHGQG